MNEFSKSKQSYLARNRIVVAAIGLTLLILLAWLSKEGPSLPLQGGCDQVFSTFLQHNPGDGYNITYCDNGDADIGEITTNYFPARSLLLFRYAGYPGQDGIEVFLEDKKGLRFDLQLVDAGEVWRKTSVVIPPELRNGHVRLVLRDTSSEPFAWIGLGNAKPTGYFNVRGCLALLAAVAGIHILLLMWLSFIQRRIDDLSIAVIAFLVGLGLVGYLAFWAYYFHHLLGVTISVALMLLAIYEWWIAVKWKAWKPIFISHRMLLPASCYGFFILLIGYYPYYDIGSSFAIAANRWLQLPIDNWIPKIFADQIWDGHVNIPMFGDWLSSDRPPLQSGINMLFYPFGRSGLLYQALSSILQSLILLPMFLLVKRIEPRAAAFVLITLGMTSLMAVHTLFVWPKLIAAAYVVIFYMFIMTSFGQELSKPVWWLLAGASAALAMLSHGGSIFPLVAFALIYMVRSKWSEIIQMGLPAAVISIAIYTPWLFYQRLFDPPGDRLLKWHLAGMIEPNNLAMFEALGTAYAGLSFEDWIDGRIGNLKVVFCGGLDFIYNFIEGVFAPFQVQQGQGHPLIVSRSFFETFYSFWWFSPVIALAVWILFRSWRKYDPSKILWLGGASLLTLIIWSMLMFIPASTVIHQGSFFSWLALFVCGAVLLWQASRWAFWGGAMLNGMIFMWFYVFDIYLRDQSSVGFAYIVISSSSFLLFVYSCLSLKHLPFSIRHNCQ